MASPAVEPTAAAWPRKRRRLRVHAGQLAALGFGVLLLYPLTGLVASVGRWHWDAGVREASLHSIGVSLWLTGLAMVIVVALGTPMALHIRQSRRPAQLWWLGALLSSILLPPLALGILLSLALSPDGAVGGLLLRWGVSTSNSSAAFVLTQVYVSIGYYVLGALAAFEAIPAGLEQQAALLGLGPLAVLRRVTLPLARLGLAAALCVAWVRAIGEFGAVVVTAYHPAGMPVQLWINLQSYGLPAVLPLLAAFLLAALPLPLLVHLWARRRRHA